MPPRRKMRSAFDVVTAVAFTAAIMAPGVAMTLRTEAPNFALENRAPAPRPAVPRDRAALAAFPQAFEAYFNDYFGLRERLTRLHHVAWFRVFNQSPSDVVVVGKDGSLFVKPEIDGYRRERPLTEEQLAFKAEIIRQRHAWLAAQGIKYLVVIVPDKATVYPELIPDSVRPMHPKGAAEALYDHLREHTDVPAIYLAPALAEARKVRDTHPRLDCHWNDYGAYVGYRETVRKLAEWFPGMAPVPEDQCVIEDRPSTGDCAILMGFPDLAESRTFMRPLEPRFEGLEDWGGVIDQIAYSKTYDASLPRAVVLHDSFMTAQRGFLARHFQTACFRWVYWGFDPTVVESLDPHVVIQEIVERQIPEGFLRNPAALTSPSGGGEPGPALVARPVENQR